MEENKEKMDSKMKQMEQIIIKFVNGRFLKIHGVSEGNHENVGVIKLNNLPITRNFQVHLILNMELLKDGRLRSDTSQH